MSCSLVVIVGQGSSRSSKRREIPDHHRRNVANHLLQTAASSVQQLLDFERQGHLCARAFLNPQELSSLEACVTEAAESQKLNAYRHRVAVLCPGVDPFSVTTIQEAQNIIRLKGTDELGFLQTFNLHQRSQAVREWTSHPRLCSTVAALLGVERVRLYQDCLFLKMPGFGETNWHSDLNMVPIDTNSFLTVWIPLRSLEKDDSSLHFASGSHRDFALPYWQSNEGMMNLQGRGYPINTYSKLALGDLTFHHGWTLHWAPGQPLGGTHRAAWTISYFADGARILCTKHARRKVQEEDAWSFQAWRKDIKEGQLARHPLLPAVFPDQEKILSGRRRFST